MILKKESWILKIAYFLSFGKMPKQVSLCKLFWRFILGILIGPLVILGTLLAIGLFYILGFCAGAKPEFLKAEEGGFTYKPYKKWPTILGHRILPMGLFLIGLGIYIFMEGVYFIMKIDISFFQRSWVAVKNNPSGIYGFCFVVLVFLGAWFGLSVFRKFQKSDFKVLISEYLKAAKNRACPIITIEE